jgi:NitT/TauT family transport system ATP-binding protein
MIEARYISKVFTTVTRERQAVQVTALSNVSLTIRDGAFVSLVGPTGCGKSTLLEILAGLQPPTSGEVLLDGKLLLEPMPTDPAELKAYQRKHRFLSPIANGLFRNTNKHDMAMIFQDYAIFPWMTARQNLLFTLKLRGVPKAEREELAMHYLRKVQLHDAANRYPSQLSGGMRQRLALARALSVEPKIILMDEPFAAVDALTREQLRDDLLDLWQGTGKTIVLVTHDLPEAIILSDEIFLFSAAPGRLLQQIYVEIPRPRRFAADSTRKLTEEIVALLHDAPGIS